MSIQWEREGLLMTNFGGSMEGAEACLKCYTDPSFFKAESEFSGAMKLQVQREKKIRKGRRNDGEQVISEMGSPTSIANIFAARNITTTKEALSLIKFELMELLDMVLKKKKNERDVKGNISIVGNEFDEEKKPSKLDGGMSKNQTERESLSPPLSSRKNYVDSREKHGPSVAKSEWYGIFVGDDVEYDIPSKDMSQSPIPEDMEESPPNKERISYLGEPTYGKYGHSSGSTLHDSRREGSGFGVCVQEYNREVMDSDDEDDLSKMDMGGRAKGVYIGGTLKHRGNGQHITSRRKQCQKLHSSLV
uniref:XRCC3/RAD51 homolog 2 helix-hairpin-helix domain-containing protein n=1 Tax=Vitis vinifera TaxID=29760 RepID=A5C0L7_VITVI|nr:hypothetical protein VITISV_040323 [Vitis vinifera]